MPTSAKLRLIADLMDDGGAFEVFTRGMINWETPISIPAHYYLDDKWEVRRKVEPDPYAELKAAHAAGKVIQWSYVGHSRWNDTSNPSWGDSSIKFRIKPDTLEERVTLLEKQMRELNPGLT